MHRTLQLKSKMAAKSFCVLEYTRFFQFLRIYDIDIVYKPPMPKILQELMWSIRNHWQTESIKCVKHTWLQMKCLSCHKRVTYRKYVNEKNCIFFFNFVYHLLLYNYTRMCNSFRKYKYLKSLRIKIQKKV